jgi:hypothetical protein
VAKPLDDGASVVSRAASDLVADAGEPFALFLNVMDAHGPLTPVRGYDADVYDAPAGWTSEAIDWDRAVDEGDETALERYRELYGASIDYLDRRTVALIDRLQSSTDRETVAVVTADHGDDLALVDGAWGHVESTLSEGLLHVPCGVIPPRGGRLDASAVAADRYVSHCRLGDLLVALGRGDPVPDVTEGAIAAERIGHSGRLAGDSPDDADDRTVRAVYVDDRKYCWDSGGGHDRYRLRPDRPCRAERLDGDVPVEDLEPRFFDAPIDEVRRRATAADDGAAIDDATEDRLRELGYL